MKYPLIRPNPARLSELREELLAIEASGIYSNNGPVVRQFEAELNEKLFDSQGACLAVSNATVGLTMAIRHATRHVSTGGRLALMPAFTFAATAHSAIWAGLTPLLCDIDPEDWAASPAAEEAMLRQYGGLIAAVVSYATFGNAIDLDRYHWLAEKHQVAIIIDGAASLGTIDPEGRGFGTASSLPIIFSMHATKTFSTAEGGVIHADRETIDALRKMANFGFDEGRSAMMPGTNAKLSEISALLALSKLREIDAVADHRHALAERYRANLRSFAMQRRLGSRQAMQFMPLLLPAELAPHRQQLIAKLAEQDVGAGHYFSPHLGEQPYFKESCLSGELPISNAIGGRMLSLPITDQMTTEDVDHICRVLSETCRQLSEVASSSARRAVA